jgi:DNA-binding beta-propeller fold protein YncE
MRMWFWLAGLLFFLSCSSEDTPTPSDFPELAPGNGFFVLNEGNFGWGEARLGFYDLNEQQYFPRLFQQTNDRPLGNVGQSMLLHEGFLYIVVNNSEKIEILDPTDQLRSVGVIDGLTSPRYMLPVSANKAYVTDLYADAISILDLDTRKKTGSIPAKGWTEELIRIDDAVWVTCRESDYIYQIDIQNDKIIDSLQVGYGSRSILKDPKQKLWVLCYGSLEEGIPGKVLRIDPGTRTIEWENLFSNAQRPADMVYSPQQNSLYIAAGGLFRTKVDMPDLQPFGTNSGRQWYALGIHPQNGHLLSADAKDYLQAGEIFEWNEEGMRVQAFEAGIIPVDFLGY